MISSILLRFSVLCVAGAGVQFGVSKDLKYNRDWFLKLLCLDLQLNFSSLFFYVCLSCSAGLGIHN